MLRRLLAVSGVGLMAAAMPLFAGVADAAPAVLVTIAYSGPESMEVGGTASFDLTVSRAYSSTNPLLQLTIVPGEGCAGMVIDPLSVVFRFDEAGPASETRTFSVSGLSAGVCVFSVVVQNVNGRDEPHAGLDSGTIIVGQPTTTLPPTTGPSTTAAPTTVPVTTVPSTVASTTSTDAESGSVLPETGTPAKDHTVLGMLLLTLGGVAVAVALRIAPR